MAIDEELPAEIEFLVGLEAARREMAEVVDMPDRLIVLFIKLCIQNGGRLSQRKREAHFELLEPHEIEEMEAIVRERLEVRRGARSGAQKDTATS